MDCVLMGTVGIWRGHSAFAFLGALSVLGGFSYMVAAPLDADSQIPEMTYRSMGCLLPRSTS